MAEEIKHRVLYEHSGRPHTSRNPNRVLYRDMQVPERIACGSLDAPPHGRFDVLQGNLELVHTGPLFAHPELRR